jgi:Mrp family chromosome partitioning ATPase
MKTVTIASAKGGSGKSTITSALAVRTSQETLQVAMMDLNFDQGSLTQWWIVRGQPMAPRLAYHPSKFLLR